MPPRPSRSAHVQQADFGPAIETHAEQVTNAASDMDLPRSPRIQSGEIAHILDGVKRRAVKRNDHLSAMRVPAELEIPDVRRTRLLGVGIVREQDDRQAFVNIAERAFGLDLQGPVIARPHQG